MTARLQASQVIDRPVAQVFHFYADEHVRNHPRWDPDIHLEKEVDAPLAVGSRIRRRNARSGKPVEGSMEVTGFDRDKSMGMLIHDGSAEMRGLATFEALGPGQTRITVSLELPGLDESADTSFLAGRLQGSLDKVKRLIESEL